MLQFFALEENVPQLYEIRAHDRYRVGREHLGGREPDATIQLESRDVSVLAGWFSKRYRRHSFPTEFNKRIQANSKSREKVKRALERDGDDVRLFVVVDPFLELEKEQNCRFGVWVIVPRDAMENDFRQQCALRVVAALKENLSACPGIDLVDVLLEAEDNFTLEDVRNTIEWDAYDYVSVGEDSSAAA